jgi:DnaJ homolog subfamily C member 11
MVQHAWETTLSHQSSFVVSGHVMALNGIGIGTITPTYRHVFSPFLWGEVSANLGEKSSVSTKAANTVARPPKIALFAGRKIAKTLTGCIACTPGIKSIAGWGQEGDSISSCSLTLEHRKKTNKGTKDSGRSR